MFNDLRNKLKKINEEIKNTPKSNTQYKILIDKKIEVKRELLTAKEKYYGEMADKIEIKLRKKRNHHIFELGGTVEKVLGQITKEELESQLLIILNETKKESKNELKNQ